ncbi:MAG: hypothetical protein LUC34_03810 [Campylobacter sp.]|nr:hypothetical protein [Campylobacter sp.]
MNADITLEKVVQQNCINLLRNFGYEFIPQGLNLTLRDGKTSNVLLSGILKERLNAINSYEYKGQTYKFNPNKNKMGQLQSRKIIYKFKH